MVTFLHLYDFLYYVSQIRFLVGHAFGVSSLPSAAMEPIPDWTANERKTAHTSLPSSTKNLYYETYTRCLDSVLRHIELILDGSEFTESSQEVQKIYEQTILSLYTPLVSHIHAVLEKEVDLQALFESYYADLMEYQIAYVAQYKATLNRLGASLASLQDKNADEYYRVIHELPLQEYYWVECGLDKGVYMTNFRKALDEVAQSKMYVNLIVAYKSCLELCSRPTYLTHLLHDLRRIQRLIAIGGDKNLKSDVVHV